MPDFRFEPLQYGIDICVSDEHRFGTDAFLLAHFSEPRHKDIVCDLGTGCGIIPLLMKIKFNPASIYGIDIQKQAIDQLKMTVEKNKLDGIIPVQADLKELDGVIPMNIFDVVSCNPPYKTAGTGIESCSEAERIARHEVMCGIDDVCRTAARLLKFGGKLCMCNRPERLADVICAMRANKIEPKKIRFVSKTPYDQSWLFLIEGKLGSKPFLQVMPQLFIQENGGFSAELLEIYGGDKVKPYGERYEKKTD